MPRNKEGGQGERGYHQSPFWLADSAMISSGTIWNIDPWSNCLHPPHTHTPPLLPTTGPDSHLRHRFHGGSSLVLQAPSDEGMNIWRQVIIFDSRHLDSWHSIFYIIFLKLGNDAQVSLSCQLVDCRWLVNSLGKVEELMTDGTRKSKKSASFEGLLEPVDIHGDLSMLQSSQIQWEALEPWIPLPPETTLSFFLSL